MIKKKKIKNDITFKVLKKDHTRLIPKERFIQILLNRRKLYEKNYCD